MCQAQCSDERATLVLFNCVLARLSPVSSFSLEPFCIILQYSYCALPKKLRSAGTHCRSLGWNLRALGISCFVLMTSFRLNLPLSQRNKGPLQSHDCISGEMWRDPGRKTND